MKKNKYKIVTMVMIILIVLLNINSVFAIDTSRYSGITTISSGDMGSIADVGGKIIYVLQFLGYTVAVIMLAVMGIKYMMAAPNEKADIKTKLTPYLIGTLLIFAGSTMLKIIYRIVTKT